ncbi:G5 domain-containing protein [Actinoplanes sp. NPDC049668]|uniref:G5 domain-containing protein n=1 Tax=unclassified Actinoplanes TaxID=2626549 RepID=UPI0033BDB4F0
MTYQPPPAWQPPGPAPQSPLRRTWSRMSPLQRAGLILGGVFLLCCGGPTVLAVIGAAIDAPQTEQVAGAAADDRDASTADGASPAPAAPALTTADSSPAAASPSKPPATVQKRTVRETRTISFKTRTVKDSSLPKGTKKVRVPGAAGVRTLTYEITVTEGIQTEKRLISSTITKKPVTKVVAIGTKTEPNCDPNYSGQCVPIDSDVDCGGGSGNGPSYVNGVVKVIGTDIYDLDRDGDGYGCD